LTILAFLKGDLQPVGRDGCSDPNRGNAFSNGGDGFSVQPGGFSRTGAIALNRDAIAKLLELIGLGRSLNLNPIGSPMTETRIG
jgi:hypothetical protein